jgi:hypothetical protein
MEVAVSIQATEGGGKAAMWAMKESSKNLMIRN